MVYRKIMITVKCNIYYTGINRHIQVPNVILLLDCAYFGICTIAYVYLLATSLVGFINHRDKLPYKNTRTIVFVLHTCTVKYRDVCLSDLNACTFSNTAQQCVLV